MRYIDLPPDEEQYASVDPLLGKQSWCTGAGA